MRQSSIYNLISNRNERYFSLGICDAYGKQRSSRQVGNPLLREESNEWWSGEFHLSDETTVNTVKKAWIIHHSSFIEFCDVNNVRIDLIISETYLLLKDPSGMWRPYVWQVECVEFRPLVKGTRECPRGSDHPRDRQDHGERSFRSDHMRR